MKFSSLSHSHIHLQMRIHSPSPHKFPTATCSDHFFNYFTLGLVSSYVHFLFTRHVACDWIHWCEWEKREPIWSVWSLCQAPPPLIPPSSTLPHPARLTSMIVPESSDLHICYSDTGVSYFQSHDFSLWSRTCCLMQPLTEQRSLWCTPTFQVTTTSTCERPHPLTSFPVHMGMRLITSTLEATI